MNEVEVRCDLDGEPTVLGKLRRMLTFTSDSKPLDLCEEDGDGMAFSIPATDGAYAVSETNIVFGPVTRALTTEDGRLVFAPGEHTYRLLLVEVD